jgi:hypothetical protein
MMDQVKLITKINSIPYSLFNALSEAVFYTTYPAKAKVLSVNRKLKNLHRGERCHILGLGPSLRNADLPSIRGEKTFSVNNYIWSEWSDSIIPDYFVLVDSAYYDTNNEILNGTFAKFPEARFFFTYKAMHVVEAMDTRPIHRHYMNCKLIQHGSMVRYDLSRNMTATMNVVLAAIQIALYMGFGEIVLHGCDFNQFTNPELALHCWNHREDDDKIRMSMSEFLNRHAIMLNHHYALDKVARKLGVRILNATPGSLIDAYERVDFKAVVD